MKKITFEITNKAFQFVEQIETQGRIKTIRKGYPKVLAPFFLKIKIDEFIIMKRDMYSHLIMRFVVMSLNLNAIESFN